jgi:hypothetical protein
MANNTEKTAAAKKQIKMRVASAWTLAKTMLPGAPAEMQTKLAESFLANPTRVLTAMLRTTAKNAHYTRIAEEFKEVHKVDINDLLEDPSVLSKAQNEVAAELKGDAKNASTKQADDRKECGVQPETYDEGKRTEPTELEASKAGERSKTDLETKEASSKKACGEGCKGDCEHMKEAAAKKAEEEGAKPETPAEEVEQEAAGDVETADSAADEGIDAADAGDTEGAENAEQEVFDAEKETLHDVIEDVKDDIETIQNTIDQEIGDAEDISIAENADGDEVLNEADDAVDEVDGDGSHEGEVDVEGIFNDEDNFADKVSALSNDDEYQDDDLFGEFTPSDAAEMESVLDGETEEDALEPHEIFAVEGVEVDPMADLIEGKVASEEIVEPGDMDSFFETELSGDDRDNETDHDNNDIFADIFNSREQGEYEGKRDKQDSKPELKPNKNAGKKANSKGAGYPTLASHFDPMKRDTTKLAGDDLARLIFPDDADY